jgi:2-polyprenyl-3-methyl-5-hydroxy-6-metoxy-1,4-benzoquinol methylase
MFKGDWYDAEYFGHKPSSTGEIKSNYGRNYGGYNGAYAASEQFVAWVLENYKTTKKSLKVVEIGCAQGHTVMEFRRQGHEAWGYDISPYILSTALPEAVPFLSLHDMMEDWETPLPLARADIVVSKDVLEHVTSEEDLKEVLTRLHRTFNPKAQLHVVNTGQHGYQAYGGDMSHGLQMPLTQWQKIAADLNLECKFVFKET